MKQIAILSIFIFSGTFLLESCVTRKDQRCKDNQKRIKKLRKSNPEMM